MRVVTVFMLLLLIISVVTTNLNAQSSERELPTNLLLEAGTESNYFPKILAYVSAQTLETAPFFTDEVASSMHAISWSPDGQYLAVIRDEVEESRDICLLKASGEIHLCFERVISSYAYQYYMGNFSFSLYSSTYPVTWSEDGQRIYFVAEDAGRLMSLVEADVSTGEILNTIYTYPYPYDNTPPIIYWTPDLSYLAIYDAPQLYSSDYRGSIELYNVMTLHLEDNNIMEVNASLDWWMGHPAFCSGFSPQGSYLTARVYKSTTPEDVTIDSFIITRPDGLLIQQIENARLIGRNIDWAKCPTWLPDEEAFYFLGGSFADDYRYVDSISIFRYTLATDDLVEYKQLETYEAYEEGRLYPVDPLVISPDGTHIAIQYASTGPPEEVQVLFPDGELMTFGDPYVFVQNPLWFPE